MDVQFALLDIKRRVRALSTTPVILELHHDEVGGIVLKYEAPEIELSDGQTKAPVWVLVTGPKGGRLVVYGVSIFMAIEKAKFTLSNMERLGFTFPLRSVANGILHQLRSSTSVIHPGGTNGE
jgi:hypothetical protein